jgi:pyruvate,water dikinase
MTNMILSSEALTNPAFAGGKAAALAKLGAQFPVPAFFVIAAEAFSEAGLSREASHQLQAAIGALGPGPFAVRSSGREEDGAGAAHAGQFESLLNVAAQDVEQAALRVWRSGFRETLSAYRAAHGLSGAPQPPAVLVQTMVPARAAGVAFSADPISGNASICVISATQGLADRLVSGEVDGDSYRIDASGRSLEVVLDADQPVLSEAERAEVAALARRAAAHFGAPQDIEWAYDGPNLKLLQSRPITTLPTTPQDNALTIWDNSNIVESYPGIVSPLTFSFARGVYAEVYMAFSRLMGVSPKKVEEARPVFENMLGRVRGRVYYNLLNWYRALALFPGFKANRAFMEQMMGVSESLPEALAHEIAPPAQDSMEKFVDSLSLAPVLLGLVWQSIRLPATRTAFYARLNQALRKTNAEIEALPLARLADEYRALERQLLTRWDAPLVNDFLCMIAFGASRSALETWAGPEGAQVHAETMIGQGDIISAEPAARIKAMGALLRPHPTLAAALHEGRLPDTPLPDDLNTALASYLEKFGDRCTEELKLESLTLHEDPGQLYRAIAAAAATQERVHTRRDPKAALDQLLGAKPLKRLLAGWLLDWAKARVRDRENLRFERTRLFARVRRIVRAMGERLAAAGKIAAPRDVFFLTIEELIGAVEGGAASLALAPAIAARKGEEDLFRAEPDPPERLETRGAFITAAPKAATVKATDDGEIRKGLACCAGIVTARVRVVHDPRTEALKPGEILVARHTDPGWIAVFTNAAGVIAERGSLLSHSAIVAREMGAPCVVGVKGAASWLNTGDLVRLDGGAGTVERLERTEPSHG